MLPDELLPVPLARLCEVLLEAERAACRLPVMTRDEAGAFTFCAFWLGVSSTSALIQYTLAAGETGAAPLGYLGSC